MRLEVVPIQESSALTLYWVVPSAQKFYTSIPHSFLSHVLGHESEGSIFAELKREGLAHTLSAGLWLGCSGFHLFHMEIQLTEQGSCMFLPYASLLALFCILERGQSLGFEEPDVF